MSETSETVVQDDLLPVPADPKDEPRWVIEVWEPTTAHWVWVASEVNGKNNVHWQHPSPTEEAARQDAEACIEAALQKLSRVESSRKSYVYTPEVA